jgi:uncharacterized membrane protein
LIEESGVSYTHSNRVGQIDALRGTAMLFVLAAHCLTVTFRYDHSLTVSILERVFMIASPSFVLISGIVMGLQYKLHETSFSHLRPSMIDRGLFLLTIVHLVIGVTHYIYFGGWAGATKFIMITDAIGIAVILSTVLLPRVRFAGRIALACALFGVSWVLMGVHLQNHGIELFKEVVLGSTDNFRAMNGFVIVPWISFFLIGTCFGEHIGTLLISKTKEKLHTFLLRSGLSFVFGALIVKLIYVGLRLFGLVQAKADFLYRLSSLFQKYPPGPVYFTFFSGIALLILYIMFVYSENKIVERYSILVSVLGRNSLYVFIVQFYVYYIILNYIRLYVPSHWLLLALFYFVSTWAIYKLAKAFDARSLNRLLTFRGLYRELHGMCKRTLTLIKQRSRTTTAI